MGKYVRSFWHFVRALTDISGKATKQIESKYNLSNVEVGTRLMFPQYESVITARIGNVCLKDQYIVIVLISEQMGLCQVKIYISTIFGSAWSTKCQNQCSNFFLNLRL